MEVEIDDLSEVYTFPRESLQEDITLSKGYPKEL